jgi:hypothetical protein
MRLKQLMKNSYRIEGEVAVISLTQGKKTYVLVSDLPLISSHRWCAKSGGRTFYAYTNIPKSGGGHTSKAMHALLMGGRADHQDNNGLNNLRSNLRLATSAQNGWNVRPRLSNRSGFKGVGWCEKDKRWQAQIQKDGRVFYLGYFVAAEDAARAYDAAATRLFGEFAWLNFPKAETTSTQPKAQRRLCYGP